jgi:hypothetical protein
MSCANSSCHCQSEVFITRGGAEYCSETCVAATPGQQAPCGCGHAGCSSSGDQVVAEGETDHGAGSDLF